MPTTSKSTASLKTLTTQLPSESPFSLWWPKVSLSHHLEVSHLDTPDCKKCRSLEGSLTLFCHDDHDQWSLIIMIRSSPGTRWRWASTPSSTLTLLRPSRHSAVLMTSGDDDYHHRHHNDHRHHDDHHHQTGGCDNMKQTEFWFSLAVCLDMAPAALPKFTRWWSWGSWWWWGWWWWRCGRW